MGLLEIGAPFSIMTKTKTKTKTKTDALLIDAKNSIYRAVYAGHSDSRFMASGHDYVVVLFRFLYKYLTTFGPSSIHIFWDTPKSRIWRKSILEEYKEGRDPNKHGFDADKEVKKCTKMAMQLFKHIGFNQYQRDKIEADDLIYAFCKMNSKKDFNSIIISSDGDFTQIPFAFDNVKLFNPLNKKNNGFVKVPEEDPVETKAFIGDKSDNVDGYYGIGPVKAKILVQDMKKRNEFFKDNDKLIFDRNRKLIDLSLCPDMAENIFYIEEVLTEDCSFNGETLKRLAYEIRGLMSEYDRIISPYKFMIESQQK